MAQWTELLTARNQCSRTYQDSEQPTRRRWSARLAALHYESVPDSDVYDAEIDTTPQHIVSAALDGWTVTANSWSYALGQPGDKATDGWVGFGQRGHWFKFRLARAGYLHWPTRAWENVRDTPTYNRANLTRETSAMTIGPNNDEVNISSVATWHNIWNTPGGGELFISWQVDGYRLKEEITVNQAAREWIAANSPPATPLDETWFGFIFQLDWSDIPQVVRAGIQQDVNGDFTDDGEAIELRTAAGLLHSFLPVSTVTAGEPDGGGEYETELQKRFWHDPDGNWYLLVGVRVDRLLALQDGDLVFDPTENMQVSASNNDAEQNGTTVSITIPYGRAYSSPTYRHGYRYVPGSNIPQGSTIDTATYSFKFTSTSYDDMVSDLYGEDGANPSVFTTGASDVTNRTQTTASVTCDYSSGGTDWIEVDVASILTELVGDYTLQAIAILLYCTDTGNARINHWDGTQADAAKLDVVYTVAGAAAAVPVISGEGIHSLVFGGVTVR